MISGGRRDVAGGRREVAERLHRSQAGRLGQCGQKDELPAASENLFPNKFIPASVLVVEVESGTSWRLVSDQSQWLQTIF